MSLTAALLRAQTGSNPAPNDVRLHALAIHHRLNEGYGSGADVYASVFGGIFRFSKQDTAIRHIRPWQNTDWIIQPVFAGKSQSTKSWVAHIQKWAAQAPENAKEAFDKINDATLNIHQGLETQDGDRLLEGITKSTDAMRWLGNQVELPIVDPATQTIEDIAKAHGGGAKPSGAGGGDVSLALLPKSTHQEFLKEVEKQGLAAVNVAPFAIGCSQLIESTPID